MIPSYLHAHPQYLDVGDQDTFADNSISPQGIHKPQQVREADPPQQAEQVTGPNYALVVGMHAANNDALQMCRAFDTRPLEFILSEQSF
jgi:hypothetical protein